MSGIRILAFGDNVVDCYSDAAVMFPGGNCLNHAVFAARAGAQAAYVGAVADDAAGRHIRAALAAEGVDISGLRRAAGQTAYCVIETRAGERVFLGANLGVSIIAPTPQELDAMAGFDAVHTGRSSHVDPWLPLMAARTRISYDLATVHDPARIALVAPHCFLLSFSGGDLDRGAAGALAATARDAGATWVLVTRGGEGALLAGPHGVAEAPAEPIEAIDTLGAGDSFIARTLTGLLRVEAPGQLLAAAARAAAETCLSRGAFGHAAPMAVDLTTMLSIDEIYRVSGPAALPDAPSGPAPALA